jgi:hypothetical protein
MRSERFSHVSVFVRVLVSSHVQDQELLFELILAANYMDIKVRGTAITQHTS